eukprot:g62552.t1
MFLPLLASLTIYTIPKEGYGDNVVRQKDGNLVEIENFSLLEIPCHISTGLRVEGDTVTHTAGLLSPSPWQKRLRVTCAERAWSGGHEGGT